MADLKQIQERIKSYAATRDRIIGEIGREQGQLENAQTKLRELGIENPENLTAEQLEELAAKSQEDLQTKVTALEQQLLAGEELIKKYNNLQEAQ